MQQEALRRRRFLLLALSPLYFLIISFFIQPFDEILQGLVAIVESPDFLITDYFVVGGPGAALFNASVSTLLCILIIYLLGMEFDGHTITSTALLFGFSLFGKNILNIWTIMLGVCLYARFHRVSITKYLYVGLYGTSLSPIITQIMHIDTLPVPVRLLLSGATGLLIGFILPPLSTHTYYAHKGYSLYNVGLACGIIATVVVSLFRSFDITIHSRLIWATDYDLLFGSILLGLFAVWIILPLVLHRQEVLQHGHQRHSGHAAAAGHGLRYQRSHHRRYLYHCGLLRHWQAHPQHFAHHGRRIPGQPDQKLEHYRSQLYTGVPVFYDFGTHCRRIRHHCRYHCRVSAFIGGPQRGHDQQRYEPL